MNTPSRKPQVGKPLTEHIGFNMTTDRRKSLLFRYGLAILLTAIGIFAADSLEPRIAVFPFQIPVVSVLLSTVFAGSGPGLVGFILLAACTVSQYELGYIKVEPDFYARYILFCILSTVAVFAIGKLRQSYFRSEEARVKCRRLVDWLNQSIVWELDCETGRSIFVSHGTERILKHSIKEWHSKNNFFLHIVHPDDKATLEKTFQLLCAGHDEVDCEHRFVTTEGEAIWFHTGFHMDNEGKTRHAIALSVNIHRLKLSEEELKVEHRMRDFFINALTHDLRNPINNALMALQLLREEANGSEGYTIASTGMQNLHRANEMIEDLLDSSLIKTGKRLPISPRPVELIKLVEDVIQSTHLLARNLILFDHSMPAIRGQWDEKYLKRLIENLISNALKHGAQNESIVITAETNGEIAFISVHNKGAPIEQEEQKKLFEQFRRVETPQGHSTKGWGIGLSIVKAAAEAHQGQVIVQSDENSGTTFKVHLPLVSRS